MHCGSKGTDPQAVKYLRIPFFGAYSTHGKPPKSFVDCLFVQKPFPRTHYIQHDKPASPWCPISSVLCICFFSVRWRHSAGWILAWFRAADVSTKLSRLWWRSKHDPIRSASDLFFRGTIPINSAFVPRWETSDELVSTTCRVQVLKQHCRDKLQPSPVASPNTSRVKWRS